MFFSLPWPLSVDFFQLLFSWDVYWDLSWKFSQVLCRPSRRPPSCYTVTKIKHLILKLFRNKIVSCSIFLLPVLCFEKNSRIIIIRSCLKQGIFENISLKARYFWKYIIKSKIYLKVYHWKYMIENISLKNNWD